MCVCVFLLCLCVSRGLLTSVASQQGGAIAQAERGEVPLSEVSEKHTQSDTTRKHTWRHIVCVLRVDDSTAGGRVCKRGPGQECNAASWLVSPGSGGKAPGGHDRRTTGRAGGGGQTAWRWYVLSTSSTRGQPTSLLACWHTVKTRSTSNPKYLHTTPLNTIYIIWFILKTGSGLR